MTSRLETIVDMLKRAKEAHANKKYALGQSLITDSITYLEAEIRINNEIFTSIDVDDINDALGL